MALAALAFAVASAAGAAPVRTPNVEAELVAERTALTPGQPLTVALRMKMREGWHTYWLNPGDSGLPTTLDWKLPPGVTAGPIVWPAPHALPAGPLINYGYEGEVFHLVDLAPAATLATGAPVTLAARADWLVCKETCIPEGADLTLTLPVAAASEIDPTWGARIAATRAALPQPLAAWRASARGNGATIALTLAPPPGARDPGTLFFFPFAEAKIEPSAPQKLARDGDAFVLTLPVASTLTGDFGRLAGVITAAGGFSGAGGGTSAAGSPGGSGVAAAVGAATLDLPLAGAVVAGPKPALAAAPALNVKPVAPAGRDIGLLAAIAFAVVGGLLLNLMPCVFPVLSLKVLGFATHHDSKATLHREAVAFATGVIGTFVILGLLLAALRAAGEQLGWGFQLQSPAVVTGLALLFFALALNLSGVFEFGMLAPQGVANWSSRNRTRRRLRLRRAGGRRRVAVHRAVHGRGDGLRADRIDGDHAGRVRRARRRHGAAVRAARLVPRLAAPAAEAGAVARALQAAAGVSAVRDGDLARLGARHAARQRRRAAPDGRAARAGLRAVGVADRPRRRRARLGGRGNRGAGRRRRRGLAAGHRRCRRDRRRGARREGGRDRLDPVHAGEAGRNHRRRPAGLRRLHRRVVRHLPGQQEAGADRPAGAARRSTAATSRGCAPTGRAATRRSPARSPRSAATACPSTYCTVRARNLCCCRKSCNGRR